MRCQATGCIVVREQPPSMSPPGNPAVLLLESESLKRALTVIISPRHSTAVRQSYADLPPISELTAYRRHVYRFSIPWRPDL